MKKRTALLILGLLFCSITFPNDNLVKPLLNSNYNTYIQSDINCLDNEVVISITFDNFPEETAWSISDSNNVVIASATYTNSEADGSTVTETVCLPNGCYDFVITDAFGDGICCTNGNGSYTVTGLEGLLVSGGTFTSIESTNICIGIEAPTCFDGILNGNETDIDCGGPDCEPCFEAPTCNDGIQNGDEIGVDCGGPDCPPCVVEEFILLKEAFFESGWDGWRDGGSDAARYMGPRSSEGSYSIRLRDNSRRKSSMTSPKVDLRTYDEGELGFYFYADSMEPDEELLVRFFDGSSWTTITRFKSGIDFENGIFYEVFVVVNKADINLARNSKFRIQCNASSNADRVYIDETMIYGFRATETSRSTRSSKPRRSIKAIRSLNTDDNFGDEEFLVYPNPVNDSNLFVKLSDGALNGTYSVMNMTGQTILKGIISDQGINVSSLKNGFYFIMVNDGEELMTKKFIKK